jgi:preprotein translocase subunit YajC
MNALLPFLNFSDLNFLAGASAKAMMLGQQLLLAQSEPGAMAPGAAAPAAGAAAGAPSMWMQLLPMVAIFGVFYFLVLRPQQKKAGEHKKFLEALMPDAQVVTQSGLYGRVVSLDGAAVKLEIADRVVVRVHKSTIAGLAQNASEALANPGR